MNHVRGREGEGASLHGQSAVPSVPASAGTGRDPGGTGPEITPGPLSRRKMFRQAAGVAVAGAAGGSVLTAAFVSPASAATTTESGAAAPMVVGLTDTATIAVDASLGNDFRVTITESRTMGKPANPSDGQQIIFQITQGAAGSATITWDSGYEFSEGLPQPTLSTAAGKTDLLGFIYNAGKDTWLLAAFVNGFS